jgi:hypothetical protein
MAAQKTAEFVETVLKHELLVSEIVKMVHEDPVVLKKLRLRLSTKYALFMLLSKCLGSLEDNVSENDVQEIFVYVGPPDSAFQDLGSIATYYKSQDFSTQAANTLARLGFTPLKMIAKSNHELMRIHGISSTTVKRLIALKRKLFVPNTLEHDELARRYTKEGVPLYSREDIESFD